MLVRYDTLSFPLKVGTTVANITMLSIILAEISKSNALSCYRNSFPKSRSSEKESNVIHK